MSSPTIHILTRTAERPNYFRDCRQSIINQQYRGDIVHIVSTDHDDPYVQGDIVLQVEPQAGNYPYNLYFNEMVKCVTDGWILHLDDDDELKTPHALQDIADAATSKQDMILWRVQMKHNRVLPTDREWKHPPQVGRISGIGFAVHASQWIDWPRKQCGDGYVIRQYYAKLNPIWIDKVLTGRQPPYREGLAQRKDK